MVDMERLIAAVHGKNMKIVMDLVVNHTSDQVFYTCHMYHATSNHEANSTYGFNNQEVQRIIHIETGMFGDRVV